MALTMFMQIVYSNFFAAEKVGVTGKSFFFGETSFFVHKRRIFQIICMHPKYGRTIPTRSKQPDANI